MFFIRKIVLRFFLCISTDYDITDGLDRPLSKRSFVRISRGYLYKKKKYIL